MGVRGVVLAVAAAATAAGATIVPANASPAHVTLKPAALPLKITSGLSGPVYAGRRYTISGRVRSRRASTVVLQLVSKSGNRILARRKVRAGGGTFHLHWTPASTLGLGFEARFELLVGHRVRATTNTFAVYISTACRPAPVPNAVPAGDGVITGSYVFLGPVASNCDASTITATSTGYGPPISATHASGVGYALVVPAGSYDLTSSGCTAGTLGHVVVAAGQTVTADLRCVY